MDFFEHLKLLIFMDKTILVSLIIICFSLLKNKILMKNCKEDSFFGGRLTNFFSFNFFG